MTRYVALLRGVNVGGNNMMDMSKLRSAFEHRGFQNVITYINSGNVIFSSNTDENTVRSACEELIKENFGLDITAGITTAGELTDAMKHAPVWWGIDTESKHNALFVIPPMTAADIICKVGETKPEYEKVDHYGKIIFWSAPLATFSRTRWSKISQNKAAYNAVTVRNANTMKKLAELAHEGESKR